MPTEAHPVGVVEGVDPLEGRRHRLGVRRSRRRRPRGAPAPTTGSRVRVRTRRPCAQQSAGDVGAGVAGGAGDEIEGGAAVGVHVGSAFLVATQRLIHTYDLQSAILSEVPSARAHAPVTGCVEATVAVPTSQGRRRAHLPGDRRGRRRQPAGDHLPLRLQGRPGRRGAHRAGRTTPRPGARRARSATANPAERLFARPRHHLHRLRREPRRPPGLRRRDGRRLHQRGARRGPSETSTRSWWPTCARLIADMREDGLHPAMGRTGADGSGADRPRRRHRRPGPPERPRRARPCSTRSRSSSSRPEARAPGSGRPPPALSCAGCVRADSPERPPPRDRSPIPRCAPPSPPDLDMSKARADGDGPPLAPRRGCRVPRTP